MSGDIIPLPDLLSCLVSCCEKAARIARTFRVRDELFGLLVEEKSEMEKNRMRVKDYKTLADVLVQETIKRDVGRMFPALSSKILGEEQNSFQNTLGESIRVELTDSLDETSSLLCKVLDGKVHIAESLAATVHSCDAPPDDGYSSSDTFPADRLGIWIDPIDSTAEYIQAKQNDTDHRGIALYGLRCVCVLIGAYDLQTGLPVMGIINQPFYREVDGASKWESNIYWGISCGPETAVSPSLGPEITNNDGQPEQHRRKVVVTSFFEDKRLQSVLESKYNVLHVAGAGYKCLVVAKALAELYVLSLQNTHFWDMCGPHAILAAQGGGIVDFQRVVDAGVVVDHSNLRDYQLRYLEESENPDFKNKGGIVAYRDTEDLFEFLEMVRESGYHFRGK